MNRFKAEEARKRRNAREGLSDLEIKHLDADEQRERLITELARKIHIERFPEEYDFYNDSIADAADRRNGISPMSEDYISRITEKRRIAGVTPLAANGMPVWRQLSCPVRDNYDGRLSGLTFYSFQPA